MEFLPVTPQQTLTHELRSVINQRNILSAKSKAKVLVALDQQIEENKRKRKFDLRCKVIEEISKTELSYLHQLELIIKECVSVPPSKDLPTVKYKQLVQIYKQHDKSL